MTEEKTQDEGLKIISLESENIQRLRAVHITPDPENPLVLITGANEQGKSSILDSIEIALSGKSAIPSEPIHRGKRKARTVADLGEYVVERTFTPTGSKLVVKDKDGNVQKSPQTLLDGFVSSISFDPLSFALMEPKAQDKVLRQLVSVDFSELDADRKALYDERTNINRDVKELEIKLRGMAPKAGDAPEEEVSVAELLAELKAREEKRDARKFLEVNLESADENECDAHNLLVGQESLIARLESELKEARDALPALKEKFTEAKAETAKARESLEAYTFPDPEEIRAQLTTVEDTNRKVRSNKARDEVKKSLDEKEAKATELTEAIEGIDEQKKETLEKAKYPIDGLSLDEGGVLLDGLPFEQACTSSKIRASIAIGAALNPKLRVLLVRRGNDLDANRLREVAAMAQEMGMQVWCERIESGGLPSVVIEDGEVVE